MFENPIMPKVKEKNPVKISTNKNGITRKIRYSFVNTKEFFQFVNKTNETEIKTILDFYGLDCDTDLFFK